MLKKSFVMLTVLFGLFHFSLVNAPSKKTPPGTQYVKSLGYYVDKQEMTILDWKGFCWFVKKISGDTAVSFYVPDSNAIITRYGSNIFDPNPPKYRDSVIVGLTPAQIEQFCKFRTWAVSFAKRGFTTVSYQPLDSATYTHLVSAGQVKGINGLSSTLPELVKFGNEYKILIGKDSLVSYSDYKGEFGFRCIAKF